MADESSKQAAISGDGGFSQDPLEALRTTSYDIAKEAISQTTGDAPEYLGVYRPSGEDYRFDDGAFVEGPRTQAASIKSGIDSDPYLSTVSDLDATLGYMVTGRDDLLSKEEISEEIDPSFWESIGTVFEPFLAPQRASWYGLQKAGAFLPDPGTAAGDALQSMAGEVGSVVLGAMLGSQTFPVDDPLDEMLTSHEGSNDPESGKIYEDGSRNVGEIAGREFYNMATRLYDALATGELAESAERNLRPWIWADFTSAPTPTGDDIIDAMIPHSTAVMLAQNSDDPTVRKFAKMMSNDTTRMMYGLGLELVLDPLWLWGPAGKSGSVLMGGKKFLTSGDMVKAAGIMHSLDNSAGSSIQAYQRAGVALIHGKPDQVAESTKIFEITREVADQAAAHSLNEANRINTALKEGGDINALAKSVMRGHVEHIENRALHFRTMSEVSKSEPQIAASAKATAEKWSKLASQNEADLNKLIASGDEALVREWLEAQSQRFSRTAISFKNDADFIRKVRKNADSVRARGGKSGFFTADLARETGFLAWHIPFTRKTHYLAKTGPVAKTGAYLRQVGFVDDLVKEYSYGSLSKEIDTYAAKIMTKEDAVGKLDAAKHLAHEDLFTVFGGRRDKIIAYNIQNLLGEVGLVPMRILDGLAKAFGTRFMQPMTEALLLENTRRISAGTPTLTIGQKSIRKIRRVSPEIWESYQESLTKLMRSYSGMEMKLRTDVVRLTNTAQKVYERRVAIAKSGKRLKDLNRKLQNATSDSEKVKLRSQIRQVQRWGSKEYKPIHVLNEAGNAIDTGMGKFAELSPDAIVVSKQFRELVQKIADDPDIAADMAQVEQALIALAREARGDANLFLEFQAQINGVEEMIGWIDLEKSIKLKKVDDALRVRVAQIKSFKDTLDNYVTEELLVKALETVKSQLSDVPYDESVHAKFIHETLEELLGSGFAASAVMRHMAVAMGQSDGALAVRMLAEKLTKDLPVFKGKDIPDATKRGKSINEALKVGLKKYIKDLSEEMKILRKVLRTGIPEEGVAIQGYILHPNLKPGEFKKLIEHLESNSGSILRSLIPDNEWDDFQKWAVSGAIAEDTGPIVKSFKGKVTTEKLTGLESATDIVSPIAGQQAVIPEGLQAPAWRESVDGPDLYFVPRSELETLRPSGANPEILPRDPNDLSPSDLLDKNGDVIVGYGADLSQVEASIAELPYEVFVILDAETGLQLARGTDFNAYSSSLIFESGVGHDDLLTLASQRDLIGTHNHPITPTTGEGGAGFYGSPLSISDVATGLATNISIRATSESGSVMQLNRPASGWWAGVEQHDIADIFIHYQAGLHALQNDVADILYNRVAPMSRQHTAFAGPDGSVLFQDTRQWTEAQLYHSKLSFIPKMISDKYGISPEDAIVVIDTVSRIFKDGAEIPVFIKTQSFTKLSPKTIAKKSKGKKGALEEITAVLTGDELNKSSDLYASFGDAGLLGKEGKEKYNEMIMDIWGSMVAAKDETEYVIVGSEIENFFKNGYDFVHPFTGEASHVPPLRQISQNIPADHQFVTYESIGSSSLTGRKRAPRLFQPRISNDTLAVESKARRTKKSSRRAKKDKERKPKTPVTKAEETRKAASTALTEQLSKKSHAEGRKRSLNKKLANMKEAAKGKADELLAGKMAKADEAIEAAKAALAKSRGAKKPKKATIDKKKANLAAAKEAKASLVSETPQALKERQSEVIRELAEVEEELDIIKADLEGFKAAHADAVDALEDARELERSAKRTTEVKESASERAKSATETVNKIKEEADEKEKLIALITSPVEVDVPAHWKRALGYFRREKALGIVKKKTYSIRGPKKAKADEIRAAGRQEVAKLGAQHAESEVLRMREIAGDIGIENLPQYGLEKHFAGIAKADLETAAPEELKPKEKKLTKDPSPEEQAKLIAEEQNNDLTSAAGSRLSETMDETKRQQLMEERQARGAAVAARKKGWYTDTKGKKYTAFKGTLKQWRKEVNRIFNERFGVRIDSPDSASPEWFRANITRGIVNDDIPVWSLEHAWEYGMSPEHAIDRLWPDMAVQPEGWISGPSSQTRLSPVPERKQYGVSIAPEPRTGAHPFDDVHIERKAAKTELPDERINQHLIPANELAIGALVRDTSGRMWTVKIIDKGKYTVQAIDAKPGRPVGLVVHPQRTPETRPLESLDVDGVINIGDYISLDWFDKLRKTKKAKKNPTFQGIVYKKWRKRADRGGKGEATEAREKLLNLQDQLTDATADKKDIDKAFKKGDLSESEHALQVQPVEADIARINLEIEKISKKEVAEGVMQWHQRGAPSIKIGNKVTIPAGSLKPAAGLRRWEPAERAAVIPKSRRKAAVTREGRKLKKDIEPLLPDLDKLREQNLELLRASFAEHAPDIDWNLVGPDANAKLSNALRPILDVLYKFNNNINYAQKSGALDNIMRAVVTARSEMQKLRGWNISPLVSMPSPGPLFGAMDPVAAEVPEAIKDILSNLQRLSSSAEYEIHFDLAAAVYRMIMNQERGLNQLDNIISQLSAVRRGEPSYVNMPIRHDESFKVYARRRGKRPSKNKNKQVSAESKRREAEAAARQELLRPERMTQTRYQKALEGMTEEDIGKSLQSLFTDGEHTDEMLDAVFAELGKRIAKRPIFKKYPHLKKLDSGHINSALADVRAKIDEFFIAEEITPAGVTRSGPAIRVLEKGSKLAKESITSESGKATAAYEALRDRWQKVVEDVQPKLPGRTVDDFDDPEALLDWEVSLWADIKKIKDESDISEEEFLLAAFSLLREAPEVPSAEMRDSLGKLYPQLMGRRLGDLDETLTPVVTELERIIKTYELEYAERSFGFMMDPVTMMKRHGVVGFVPHLNKTQDEVQLGTRALLHKQREGGGAGLDQVIAMGFDATKSRKRFGSLQEINALVSTVEAHGTEYLTLDPQVVWARYSQANKAITNEDFVFDLINGGVFQDLHPSNTKLDVDWTDATGRTKTAEEVARELDVIPIFDRQPDVNGRYHSLQLLLDGTLADWEKAGLIGDDIKSILLAGHVNANDAFATWINHGPQMTRLRQLEDAVIRRRQWDLQNGNELFNPMEEFTRRINEPVESAMKEWDDTVAPVLQARGDDASSIAMNRAQAERDVRKSAATELWETIAQEMNAVAQEAGFSAERGMFRVDGKSLFGYYGKSVPSHRLYVPRVVAQSMRDVLAFTPTPGVTKAAFDKINNWWKTRVTVIALAFSARNAVSNQMMQFLDLGPFGALNPWTQTQSSLLSMAVPLYEEYGSIREAMAFFNKPLKSEDIVVPSYFSAVSGMYKAAAKASHAAKRQAYKATFGRMLKKGFELERGVYTDIDDVISEMLRRGIVSPAYTAMVDINSLERNLSHSLLTGGALGDGVQAQKMMKIGSALEDMVMVALPFTVSGGSIVAVPKGFGANVVSRTVENQARIMNFMGNYRRTKDWTLATNHVEKFLFNYGDLTKFQKNWMRTIVPFFTWNQKNMALQIELMQTSPQLYSTFHRLMIDGLPQAIESTQVREGDRYVPTEPLSDKELRKHEIQYLHTVKMPFPSLENTWLGDMRLPAKDIDTGAWRWGTLGKDYFPRMKHAQIKGLGLPQEAFVEKLSLLLGAVDHKNLPMFKGARAYEDRQRWARFISEIHFLGRFAVENAMNHNVFYDKPIHELTDGRLVAASLAGVRRTPIVGPVMANEMARMFGLNVFRVFDERTGQFREYVKVDGNPNYVFSSMPYVRTLRSAAANTDILMTSKTVPAELYNEGWGDPAETRPIPLFWRGVDSLTGFNIVQSDPEMMTSWYYYKLDEVMKKQMESVGAYRSFKKTYIDD